MTENNPSRGDGPWLTRREFLKVVGVAGAGAVVAWFTSPTFREDVINSRAYKIASEIFNGVGKEADVAVEKGSEAWEKQQQELLKVDKQLAKKK